MEGIRARILAEIDDFCASNALSSWEYGIRFANDGKWVTKLRRGMGCRLDKIESVAARSREWLESGVRDCVPSTPGANRNFRGNLTIRDLNRSGTDYAKAA